MKFAVASLLLIAVLLTGCAKSTVSTPGTPSAGALQFETYAEAAIAAAETATALIPGLSASDQQIAQIALSDLGTGIVCVVNESASTDSTALKIQKTASCLQALKIPPQASPRLVSILNGAFSTIQAFFAAYEQQTASQQAATVANVKVGPSTVAQAKALGH